MLGQVWRMKGLSLRMNKFKEMPCEGVRVGLPEHFRPRAGTYEGAGLGAGVVLVILQSIYLS